MRTREESGMHSARLALLAMTRPVLGELCANWGFDSGCGGGHGTRFVSLVLWQAWPLITC